MTLIITNDEGHEAARRADRKTAIVTEIDPDKLAAVIVRHRETDPWMRGSLETSIVRSFESLFEASRNATGKKVAIVFTTDDVNLEIVDEKRMNEAGWIRDPKRKR